MTQPPDVYFSPGAGTEQAIARAIDNAAATVLVQCYTFTSRLIAGALVRARARGLFVEIILDKCSLQRQSRGLPLLRAAKLPVLIDHQHTKAHNKVVLIDAALVITGSYNFTEAADVKNAENCLFLHDPQTARLYAENYDLHRAHSTASNAQIGPFAPPPPKTSLYVDPQRVGTPALVS
jgi:phosphatidylserine/phosphatidylglycerophosphate/cardiolipin synthase-like enzyme